MEAPPDAMVRYQESRIPAVHNVVSLSWPKTFGKLSDLQRGEWREGYELCGTTRSRTSPRKKTVSILGRNLVISHDGH